MRMIGESIGESFSEGNFVAAQHGNYYAQNLQNSEGTANLSDRKEKPTNQLLQGSVSR